MKSEKIRRAIGGIDDDIIESADSKKTRKSGVAWIRWSSVAAVFVLLLTGAFVLPGVFKQNNPIVDPGTQSLISDIPDGGDSNGAANVNIPIGPATNELTFVGEKITDDEATAYFEENKASIFSALSSNGVKVTNAKISEKGYCHIKYDGTLGKGLEVIQNFRDYLVYNGDKLVAIVTLSKENGKLYNSPAFGSSWLDKYNEYLNAHKGQELIYLYAGSMEIILAPDGDNVNPLGSDVTEYLSWVKNPYEWFYDKDVVFVP